MQFTKGQLILLGFNFAYVIAFGSYYVQRFNYEFMAYAALIVLIMALIFGTLHITRFPTYIIAGLSSWGLLHMMGGSVPSQDGVLYAWRIYPFFDGGNEFYILKFDQVVHGALYAVVALMFLHLLKNIYLLSRYELLIAFIALMAALGVSAINEIVEFTAVVLAPETGVGGYYNTMLDIVFNFGGALLAVVSFYVVQKLKSSE